MLPVQVVENGSWVVRPRMSLRAGEVVRVSAGANVPADLIVLGSSDEEGCCYIDTMNLDGETNLKMKKALERAKKEVKVDGSGITSLDWSVTFEGPRSDLYTFRGSMEHADGTVLPCGPDQLLLRGCRVHNTKEVWGVVVYTGRDTRVMRNSSLPPSKMSNLERTMNKLIYFLCGVLAMLCTFAAIGAAAWDWHGGEVPWYIVADRPSVFGVSVHPALWNFLWGMIAYSYLM